MERIHGRKLTVSDKIPLLMGLLCLKGLGTESYLGYYAPSPPLTQH